MNLSAWILGGLVALGLSIAIPAVAKFIGWIRTKGQEGPADDSDRNQSVRLKAELDAAKIEVAELHGALAATADKMEEHLVIHSATYGPKGERGRDVTGIVREHLRCGLTIKASNTELGGDPAPSFFKWLKVIYSNGGGERDTATTGENDVLVIPEISPPVAELVPHSADLETTILNGYIGTPSEKNTKEKEEMLLVMLEIMVSGKGHKKIAAWDLQLLLPDGSVWRPTAQRRFRMAVFSTQAPNGMGRAGFEVVQMREDVPVDSGFVLFVLPGAAALSDYIFGTRFMVLGREERNILPSLRSEPKPASEWLKRAVFSFVGEEP